MTGLFLLFELGGGLLSIHTDDGGVGVALHLAVHVTALHFAVHATTLHIGCSRVRLRGLLFLLLRIGSSCLLFGWRLVFNLFSVHINVCFLIFDMIGVSNFLDYVQKFAAFDQI